MKAYTARKLVEFMNGSTHFAGRTYFPKPETQSYFDVMAKDYQEIEVETMDVGGRTFAVPDHHLGYTKTYLLGYMESCGYSIK